MIKAPHTPAPAQRLDHSDVTSLTDQLMRASEELAGMTQEVAKARVVREFSGDRRKRALALSTREFLGSDSAAAAEVRGRASVSYGEALDSQEKELRAAEEVISKHDATRTKWESIRSALSMAKAICGNV